ncbi:hypothetical protein LZ30DRAFT_687562 [Colletotrichum cereale]|nr:hypothetical protein LZ30DRAFT_687562 [Colletotrichum cereale]
MDIPKLTFNPPSGDAITPPTTRTVDRASSKMGLAAFSTLDVAPHPNGGVASSLSSLLPFDFTTPTKAGASPKSKSTTKRQAPKFVSLALASPSKKYSTAETPRPNKGISTDLKIVPSVPSTARTPSPKKVSFADDSFTPMSASTPKHFCASTPKLARGLSPKSSPSKPAFSDFSVMSITSPITPQLSHDQFDSIHGQSETRAALLSPSDEIHEPEPEYGAAFESPSKADTTMHDITMLSDMTATSPRKPQGHTFASVERSETAKKLCAPFDPESFDDFDFTSTLAPVPDFPRRPARAPRVKQQRKTRGLILEKAIAKRVTESLTAEELDAAVQFRHIAVKGDLAYALCPRKRQRVADWTDEDYSEPYWLDEEVEERPVINMIEARRVLRNDLFSLPAGPSVREQRQQYKADMEKYGEVVVPARGKRNYDGEPKRAYNNGLLTHAIMKPLLAFPMPDLSFEWVLETAIRDSNKAHGRQQEKHRNVRQPIAVFGESDFSVIEEEDEPQSPTSKLPHFPSSATHHSEASRKTRLDQGLVSLRSKLATFVAQEREHAPVSPLSSPIGPGFTFEVPSFISSPGVTETDGDDAEQGLEGAPEPVASPIVYFKDRSQTSPFKKRKSLPATRRPSLTSLLRRVSLPLTFPAADSDQLPVVQDLQDPASGSLVGAPDASVELPAVQNPSEEDSASAAFVQASPGSAGGVSSSSSSALALASPLGSSSPSSVVVDARENPDIFGSFQERPDSPIQAPASLAHVFEEAREMTDGSVLVSMEGDRLMVRFKVSEKYAALIAAEDASAASSTPPAALAGQEEEQGEQDEREDEELQQVSDQAPAPAIIDDDSDLIMLREFMNRHAARKAAKAAEPAEPVETVTTPPLSPTPIPSAPIVAAVAPTPERAQGIWVDTPAFSVTCSAERPRSVGRTSPAVSTARQPLGTLDVNSPSPRKVKRKVDDVEGRGSSPEKKPQPPKRQRREKAEKPGKAENEKPGKDENTKPAEDEEEEEAGPVAGVRTRAQRAAERGEPAPATKIPVRHKGYAKLRNGEKDLAVMTRQNTRTNKGSALPAEQVLESLKNAPPTVETEAVAAARKSGKSVQWAEQLARSQSEEPSLTALSSEEEKEVGKARGRPKGSTGKTGATKSSSSAKATTTKSTTAKSTTAAKSAKERRPAIPGPKTEGAKVSKPKKVSAAAKKELGLSANGTPAKRSARIAKK